jgi:hypothetical protein
MGDREQRERESRESAEDKFHERVDEEREQRGRIAEHLDEELREADERKDEDERA